MKKGPPRDYSTRRLLTEVYMASGSEVSFNRLRALTSTESAGPSASTLGVRRAKVPNSIQNIDAILRNGETKSRPANKKWWADDPHSGEIAMMKKLFILKHALQI